MSEAKNVIKEVCFNVEGAFIASMARDLVAEGNWEQGITFLQDSLMGISVDLSIAVLNGSAELRGNSSDKDGVFLEEVSTKSEESIKLDKQLEFLYGNVFKHNGKYWKPYAKVTSWGGSDLSWSSSNDYFHNVYANSKIDLSLIDPGRSLFYADNRQSDLVCIVTKTVSKFAEVVLCKETKMPPFWMGSVSSDVNATILKVLAAEKSLSERGFVSNFGENEVTATTDPLNAVDIIDDIEESIVSSSDSSPISGKPEIDKAISQAVVRAKMKKISADFTLAITSAKSSEDLRSIERSFYAKIDEIKKSHFDVYPDDEVYDAVDDKRQSLWKQSIIDQANKVGGWTTLQLESENGDKYDPPSIKVPTTPFEAWCFRNASVNLDDFNITCFKDWNPVCPSGAKMLGDDPYHSDWMLGAGIDLNKAYSSSEPDSLPARVMAAAYATRYDVIRAKTAAQFVVLAHNPEVTSFYGKSIRGLKDTAAPPGSIVVVPNASPDYQLAMTSACAPDENGKRGIVICETGGKLAHLATVGREFNCTVIMVPGALSKYLSGQYSYDAISIDMSNRSISVVFY